MTPQAPITQPATVNKAQEVKISDQLQRGDIQQVVREAYLRQLLQNAITQNDQESIITGVTVVDMQSQQTLFSHNKDTEHFAASINKVPVALLVLEDLRARKISLDQVITWQPTDVRGGFGVYDQPGAPTQAPLRDVLYDMLNHSGNTVVRATVNYVLGGVPQVNQRLAAKPQLAHTSLTDLGGGLFYLGNSTPSDSLWALQELVKTPDRYTRFMKDALATNIFTDFGVRSELDGHDNIVLVNKIGLLDDIEGNNRHDVGVVYNKRTHKSYGYSFFTTSPYASPTATPRADQSLKDMGSYVLRYAGKSHRTPRAYATYRQHIERRIRY